MVWALGVATAILCAYVLYRYHTDPAALRASARYVI